MIRDEEFIRDDLKFFSDKDSCVHITSKLFLANGNRKWWNGKVIKFYDDRIDFMDEEEGLIPIRLSDILIVEKRKEKKE